MCKNRHNMIPCGWKYRIKLFDFLFRFQESRDWKFINIIYLLWLLKHG